MSASDGGDLALVRVAVAGGVVDPDAADRDPVIAVEGLQGLLHARRVEAGAVPVPSWRAAHRRVAAMTLLQLEQLRHAVAALRRAGAEPAVLPGAALMRFYPDAGCRPMDDVDLLCPPGRHEQVCAALRSAGWAPVPRHPGLWYRQGVTLDLHTDLFNTDRIRQRRRAGYLDPERVWARCRRGPAADLLVLAAADEVMYTAAHALRHSYGRLTWLVDLALQVRDPDLDGACLQATARQAGLHLPVLYGLYLLQRAGVGLAPAWTAWLAREPLSRWAPQALAVTLQGRGQTCLGELLWCLTCPSIQERARLLCEFVFPRPQVLLQVFPRLPRRLAPLAYALRCGQILRRGARELAALAARPGGRALRR